MDSSHKWNARVFTDFARQFINDLTMSGHLGLEMALLIDAVATAFPQQHCAVRLQMFDKLDSLHVLKITPQTSVFMLPIPSINHPLYRALYITIEVRLARLGNFGDQFRTSVLD